MGIEVLELELTIIRGDGLAAKDNNIFGVKKKSDPYVEVILCPWGPLQGEDKKILVGKTLPKMKTLSPRWDETFTTSFPSQQFSEFAAFQLRLFDYDKYTDDDPMGVILVKIPPLGQDEISTKWYRIPATSLGGEEEATGRVECTLRSKKRVLKDGEQPKAYQDPVIPLILRAENKKRTYLKVPKVLKKKKTDTSVVAATSGPKEDQVELDITITRARNLAAMDTNLLGMKSKSDPYIVVRFCPQGTTQGGSNLYVGKTPTMFHTLDPVWKDQNKFSLTLPREQCSRWAMFELTIWDYDKSNDDDIMGIVPIPVKLDYPGTTTKWYKVPEGSAGGAGAKGDVECILSIKLGGSVGRNTNLDRPLDVQQSLSQRISTTGARKHISQGAIGPKRVEILEMELKVIRAKGLAALDSNVVGMRTSSDPYVIVKFCPLGPTQPDDTKILLGQTDPVLQSLSPTWNETFRTSSPKKDLTEFAIFELTIWDYDESNDDDLMGKVAVHIPMARSGTTTKWYEVPASSADGVVASGEVECSLTIIRLVHLEGSGDPESEHKRPSYVGSEAEPSTPLSVDDSSASAHQVDADLTAVVDTTSEISEAPSQVTGDSSKHTTGSGDNDATKDGSTTESRVDGGSEHTKPEADNSQRSRPRSRGERQPRTGRAVKRSNTSRSHERRVANRKIVPRRFSSIGTEKPGGRNARSKKGRSSRRSGRSGRRGPSRGKGSQRRSLSRGPAKKTGPRRRKDSRQGSSSSLNVEEVDIDEEDAKSELLGREGPDHGSSSTLDDDIVSQCTSEPDDGSYCSSVDVDIDVEDVNVDSEGEDTSGPNETESADTANVSAESDVKAINEGSTSSQTKEEGDGDIADNPNRRGSENAKSNSRKSSRSDTDGSASGRLNKSDSDLFTDPEKMLQQRLKVCSIYQKWHRLKETQTTLDQEKARLMMFPGL